MLEKEIAALVDYAVAKKWITKADRIWASNRVLEILNLTDFDALLPYTEYDGTDVQYILDPICDYAYENGVIEGNSAVYRDLLDTKLIGALLPFPSAIHKQFYDAYAVNPKEATDWYYTFSQDTNYVRRERIKKDQRWKAESAYGTLDISINLSKPEKDPKAIAAAAKMKSAAYPKCLLCIENEGFAGHLNHPARQNHRIIPVSLGNQDYFLQYSPYVYYNEHCIVFNKEHTPMHIDKAAFTNLLDFISIFPHYFVGSNADLPIVGGSVLSHDHYQGGCYTFPMEVAEIEETFTIPGYEDVTVGIVNWPMSVIRIAHWDSAKVADLAEHILNKWRAYDDADCFIFHETDGERHNTITPIARGRNGLYEMDLVLRNNITTDECPLGVFHPHAEKHHIKKENIGLIEVMGLAVLPARLKDELALLREAMLKGEDVAANDKIASHAEWAAEVLAKHPEFNADNAEEILKAEVGVVFAGVLEDAGVYKRDEAGKAGFHRFIASL